MIEVIKNSIWNLLKEKEVSLAMLYDKKGKIVWNKGRKIIGNTVQTGAGFSKTYIQKSLTSNNSVKAADNYFSMKTGPTSDSVQVLHIKSLLILPINNSFFLYVDSGTKESFNRVEYERFKSLGEILGDTIRVIKKCQNDTGGITGNSEKIKSVRTRVVEYALVDEPILLKGETGTGKNYIAELIHRYSGRPGKFMIINTPGIPGNLFENEIFGHIKGAFTDAWYDKKGLIQEAKGGTLFIDEITEVPISIQAKLMRFVETKKYNVLGEPVERTANVRIVAATNKDIAKAIEDKEFRKDLYYRLNVLEIDLPPLRDRKEDLKDLVYEKLKHLNGKKLGEGFWDALYNHDWPGNIRELISVLKRAGIFDKDVIDGQDIHEIINLSSQRRDGRNSLEKIDRVWNKMKSGGCFWDVVKAPFLDRELNRCEVRDIIKRGLLETAGKYKGLLAIFNLGDGEYKNFMRFLYDNRLR